MRPQEGPGDGRRPPSASAAELVRLRSTCREQSELIVSLRATVSALRSGAAALEAENADLRGANGNGNGAAAIEAALPLDVQAPAAARLLVHGLSERVETTVIEVAQLVVSELVTNSVRHSGESAEGTVLVRLRVTPAAVCIEVEDEGSTGAVAPRAPDLEHGGGFGLNMVQAVSERWGLERLLAGGTRVWAHVPRLPAGAAAGT